MIHCRIIAPIVAALGSVIAFRDGPLRETRLHRIPGRFSHSHYLFALVRRLLLARTTPTDQPRSRNCRLPFTDFLLRLRCSVFHTQQAFSWSRGEGLRSRLAE